MYLMINWLNSIFISISRWNDKHIDGYNKENETIRAKIAKRSAELYLLQTSSIDERKRRRTPRKDDADDECTRMKPKSTTATVKNDDCLPILSTTSASTSHRMQYRVTTFSHFLFFVDSSNHALRKEESTTKPNDIGTVSTVDEDVLRSVSTQLKSERAKRCPGPQLTFTMTRLSGGRLMPDNIRDLLVYSLIGYSSCKPIWCNYRPWKATSQAVLIRVNSTDEIMEVCLFIVCLTYTIIISFRTKTIVQHASSINFSIANGYYSIRWMQIVTISGRHLHTFQFHRQMH